MSSLLKRRLDRTTVTVDCETVTPMFLGNADQEAEWRSEPFKGLLRYWWRVGQPDTSRYNNTSKTDLLEKEARLFGYAGEQSGIGPAKSQVRIVLEGRGSSVSRGNKLTNVRLAPIHHREVHFKGGQISPLVYLAGMGLMNAKDDTATHSFFPPRLKFAVTIDYAASDEDALAPVLALIQTFGAMGARCRNGWGCFRILKGSMSAEDVDSQLQKITMDWTRPYREDPPRDYPSCLGKDQKGPLLWKTHLSTSWEDSMRQLAEAYVKLRTGDKASGVERLDANGHDKPGERHLLGFPLSPRHPAQGYGGWGNKARHASPLRLMVRSQEKHYQGFVLHLPHAHSREMKLPAQLNELKVWEKVHGSLDKLLHRATYKECL